MAVSTYKDTRGRLRCRIEFQQGGARIHRRCPAGVTLAQARELEIRLRRELFDVGELDHKQDVPLAAAIQLWLESTLPHRKDKTVTSKAHQWADFLAGRSLHDAPTVATNGIAAWRSQGITAATVNRRLCVLKATMVWAFHQGLIGENLSSRIRLLPGEKKRDVYLTEKQILLLAKCSPSSTTRSAIMISAYSGLRASELLRLKSTPYTAQSFDLSETKSGKPRSIPIVDKIRPYLSALPIPLSYRQLIGEFWIAREAAGLPHVRWHDLRHSFASLLANEGVDLYVIGKLLGHASMQTTSRYAHLQDETMRAAMAKIGNDPTSIPSKPRLQRVK
jgi:site-specific recombinase XerD